MSLTISRVRIVSLKEIFILHGPFKTAALSRTLRPTSPYDAVIAGDEVAIGKGACDVVKGGVPSADHAAVVIEVYASPGIIVPSLRPPLGPTFACGDNRSVQASD